MRLTEQKKEELKFEGEYGVLIRQLVEGELFAKKIGLKPNDIVLEIDGEKAENTNQLIELIKSKYVGFTVNIKIWRDGKEKEFKEVELAARSEEGELPQPAPPENFLYRQRNSKINPRAENCLFEVSFYLVSSQIATSRLHR